MTNARHEACVSDEPKGDVAVQVFAGPTHRASPGGETEVNEPLRCDANPEAEEGPGGAWERPHTVSIGSRLTESDLLAAFNGDGPIDLEEGPNAAEGWAQDGERRAAIRSG
jgi:hypothetical protein